MRLLFALLLSTIVPGLGSAQSPAAGSATLPEIALLPHPGAWIGVGAPSAPNAEASLPLWSTPDGRILAIVASGSHGAPVAPQSPQIGSAVDWKLVDVTSFITGGLALKMGDGRAAYARFGRGIVLAPGNTCNPQFRSAASTECLAAAATLTEASVGTQLQGENADLDFNFGLSWLRSSEQPGILRQPWDLFQLGDGSLPTLLTPGYALANAQSAGFNLQSHWRLDDNQMLDLGAALSRIQYELPGAPLAAPNLNQAALSLGMRKGDFSGQIIGRVLGPSDVINGGQHWSSIDLGISWRAPWRGVFSVGAQNLWSSGSLPALNEPAHEVDPSQARVPYVQYHQDL